MGRKIEAEETVSHKFLYLPSNFAPRSNWRSWHEPCLPYPRYITAVQIRARCRDSSSILRWKQSCCFCDWAIQ